ncbi:MAG: T9SS type A sorting domain-containing protein [Bacteroidota bacterium]
MKNKFGLVLIFATQLLFAQNPLVKKWDYSFGGTYTDKLNSIQQTSDDGFILGGYTDSGIGGDKTQALWGGYDYWIVKTDSLGNKQWDKDFGGTNDDELFSLQQTSDGGFILGGWSNSGISGDKTQTMWGSTDFWIVKTDALGNKQWDKDFGGTNWDDLSSILQTSDGGYLIGGSSESGINGDKTQAGWGGFDYWIVKTDSLGNKQWDKDFGGTGDDHLFSVRQTSDGGFILGGYSVSGISGNKTQAMWGVSDYWIVKTDSLGNKQWDKDFGGTLEDDLYSIQQTLDGGYILGGTSWSGISGDKTQATWGQADYWILKTDSLGNKQWDKDFGGIYPDGLSTIEQTSDGGYLVSGESTSDSSGNKTENNFGQFQTWVLKIDAIGNIEWDKTIFTNGSYYEGGIAIQTRDDCYLMGNFSNGGIGGYKTQPSQGFQDYWIIKFCDSTFTTNISQTQIKKLQSEILLTPNPTTALLKIESTLSIEHIEFFNLLGEKMPLAVDCLSMAIGMKTVDCSLLPPGIYILQAAGEGKVWRGKIIKE